MSKLDYPRRNAQLFRPVVVVETKVETAAAVLARVETRHGKHKDAEAHRVAMRARMRAKRASQANQKQG